MLLFFLWFSLYHSVADQSDRKQLGNCNQSPYLLEILFLRSYCPET